MADDLTKIGSPDNKRLSFAQEYEVYDFINKYCDDRNYTSPHNKPLILFILRFYPESYPNTFEEVEKWLDANAIDVLKDYIQSVIKETILQDPFYQAFLKIASS